MPDARKSPAPVAAGSEAQITNTSSLDSNPTIKLPASGRERRTAAKQAEYKDQLYEFCQRILKINSRLDFDVSARGWCYILEEFGLLKGDFDKAQKLIADTRKSGMLPLNITAEDSNRETLHERYGLVYDEESPQEYLHSEADVIREAIRELGGHYQPEAFWDSQEYYVEMWVNTILGNLKSALRSTYHAVRPKYSQRYLAEFQYRFNRRYDLPALVDSLCRAAVNSPPMPDKMLKLGLA